MQHTLMQNLIGTLRLRPQALIEFCTRVYCILHSDHDLYIYNLYLYMWQIQIKTRKNSVCNVLSYNVFNIHDRFHGVQLLPHFPSGFSGCLTFR